MSKKNHFSCKLIALCLFAFLALPLHALSLYWENPRTVSSSSANCMFPKSVWTQNTSQGIVFWEEADTAQKQVYLSCSITQNGSLWSTKNRFAGPFAYSGDVPDLYSVAMGEDGTILLATVSIEGVIELSASRDGGTSFKKVHSFSDANQLLAPRLYVSSNGTYFLFASLSKGESFSIKVASSRDGSSWSDLADFTPASSFSNAMVPYLAPVKGGDVVVFQAHYTVGNRNTFQLYASSSTNNGHSWSNPVLLTGSNSILKSDTAGFENYNNQSPVLLSDGTTTYLAWERARYGSTASNIWVAELNRDLSLASVPERISTQGKASRPLLFNYKNTVCVVWFDTRSGQSQVYCNQKTDINWDTEDEMLLSLAGKASSFAVPVISAKGSVLSFAWNEQTASASRIVVLVSDASCEAPLVKALNFTSGKTYASESARVSLTLSDDSSGLAGFSYIWTKDADAQPPKLLQHMPHEATSPITVKADSDGQWFFKVMQCDKAGNWSEVRSLSYNYDSTPPGKPVITEPELDDMGFVASSVFSLNWKADSEDSDIAGYTWSLTYLMPLPEELVSNRYNSLSLSDSQASFEVSELIRKAQESLVANVSPPQRLMGRSTSASYTNRRNGVYVFSVAAVDEVGHVGKCAQSVFVINKYNPSTYISSLRTVQNENGSLSISIAGSGFTYDGKISAVYIDKDGLAPYDITLTASKKEFTVESDSAITGIYLEELEAGTYFVGVNHPVRGIYFVPKESSAMLTVDESGTVKINDTYTYIPAWKAFRNFIKYNINITMVVLALALVLALLGFAAALHGIAKTAKEAVLIRAEVDAIVKGGLMPQEKKAQKLKQKTTSLKYKLIGYSASLVITIVALITFPLALYMTNQQKQTLYEGLQSRVHVLLDALVSEAKTNLPPAPAEDRDKLDNLPDQMNALTGRSTQDQPLNFISGVRDWIMKTAGLSDPDSLAGEAVYVTITGFDDEMQSVNYDYVWATNDQALNPPLENADDISNFTPGADRLYDFKDGTEKEYTANILSVCSQINEAVAQDAQTLSEMYGPQSATPSSKRLRDELDALLVSRASESIGSFPEYNLQDMNEAVDEFIFYEPVLDKPGSAEVNGSYVRGIVLVKVNTQSLKASVKNSRVDILLITFMVILIAVLIGLFGSLLLASIIIKPIKLLVSHVAMIRDTEDKEQLDGKDIAVTSRDEIGILGDTVNEMTHGLVQAAIASKNLIVGKEVQTRFLPLQTDKSGSQLTTGSLSVSGADFFSYYAGADELSGDYFDYRQIDKNRYAIIKCDVSGHGVPAALIMVEVATLFLNYFSKWNPKQNVQSSLQMIVGRINDLLEQRGFKGRFAAFTLCVLDTESGEAFFCNAGDNLVQVYDGQTQTKKTVTLPETPAAGMFSTDLVEMKGGYPVSRYVLKKGDVLFLYTDGIEEAKRNFRDADSKIVPCAEPGLEADADHGNHKVGETSEEMTPERVTAIIEAVFRKQSYELEKWHNPHSEERFTFDFSTCSGTAEEAIMALVSVEKIFRLYKNTEVKPSDRVKVDKKIDQFLETHFRQYSSYASDKMTLENDTQNVYWHGVCEDPQYDDLTLIAIKKN
ncbi:MAG TPA: hypothetical protein DC014_02190 [Treponema sp.]|nr:hypothetical protein [Treponema sp.]